MHAHTYGILEENGLHRYAVTVRGAVQKFKSQKLKTEGSHTFTV